MTGDDDGAAVVRGSGNLFHDLGLPNPELEHLRAVLAAKIIAVLDDEGLGGREAQAATGVAAADFSRIRKVKLDRFTVDRLMTILSKLGQEVDVSVDVHPRSAGPNAPLQPRL